MKQNKSFSPAATGASFVGISLVLSLLFDLLFFEKTPGISFVIYIAAIAGGLFALAHSLKRPLPKSALWLLLPLGFFAAMVAVRASPLLIFLDIFASLLLLLLIARVSFRDNLKGFKLLDYAKIPLLPLKFFAPLLQTFATFFALRSTVKNHSLTIQITRGILLAIPALVIFLALFTSADLVFQKYVTDAFDLQFDSATIARAVVISLVTLGFTGAYAYIFRQQSEQSVGAISATTTPARIGKVEVSILLGSVAALFLLFIVVQLAYLFGGQSNISGQGFTYAEYARKGFFELLLVALVAFAMLWVADKTAAKSKLGHSLGFRVLSSVLIAQVLLIMASAFKRLYLYEQVFGFTTLRLYSHVFVMFLAVIFVLLLIKILKNQNENRFAFPAFMTTIAFLASMNLLNPDAFIARQNLDRFYQTGKLDSHHMAGLSEDALPEVKTAINATTGSTKRHLLTSLDVRSAPSNWQSWNLARNQSSR